MQESRVGSKGELFPPKEIREKLGLKACSKIIFTVESGRLVVEPVPTIKEAIEMGTPVEITLEEFHNQRRELSRQAEA
jgi:AbrB family looped-hinge helix DNA binding protein